MNVKRVRLLVIMNFGSITCVQKENENVHGAFKSCWVILIFLQLSGALAEPGFLKKFFVHLISSRGFHKLLLFYSSGEHRPRPPVWDLSRDFMKANSVLFLTKINLPFHRLRS